MLLIGSWGRGTLIVAFGRRGGGRGGRMGGVIDYPLLLSLCLFLRVGEYVLVETSSET